MIARIHIRWSWWPGSPTRKSSGYRFDSTRLPNIIYHEGHPRRHSLCVAENHPVGKMFPHALLHVVRHLAEYVLFTCLQTPWIPVSSDTTISFFPLAFP
jgi:hypothetical protein